MEVCKVQDFLELDGNWQYLPYCARFVNLNARIALSMQDDIVQLEENLDAIERILSAKNQD
jgi:hypothetical protein